MGYIKKLKNNELVGGTDKHTIYPVTSTKAVFEEVTEGNESSFKTQETINKEQQDELDDHEERIQTAEAEDIKSITINGSTKKFEVDGENNVDLTIYTVDSDPEMPDIADKVGELRDMVGTSTPVLETSHKTRIENLEATVGTGGSVDQRISDAVTIEKNRAEGIEGNLQTQINGKQKTLSVGAGITLTSDGVISATADPSVGKVVEARPSTDIVDGMIYLVQTETPGTYKQWVHSDGEWVDKGNISLGITTDSAISSVSTNPIQNDAITAQIGYFVCSSSGNSATKEVDAPSYSPSDVGGAFKIKMNNTNTCSDTVYLQFNSNASTKKELRYNRQPVTPTNTWNSPDGNPEVISVYYDGTYYQATNAQGADKADKIKYNNSQSGLAAENVQGALDEVTEDVNNIDVLLRGGETTESINLGSVIPTKGYINGGNGKWVLPTNDIFCLFVPIPTYAETFSMTANNAKPASYVFLKSTSTSQNNMDYATGYTNRIQVAAGASVNGITIPNDAHFVYIYYGESGESLPSYAAFKYHVGGEYGDIEYNDNRYVKSEDTDITDDLTWNVGYNIWASEDGGVAVGALHQTSAPHSASNFYKVKEGDVLELTMIATKIGISVGMCFYGSEDETDVIQANNCAFVGYSSTYEYSAVRYIVPKGAHYFRTTKLSDVSGFYAKIKRLVNYGPVNAKLLGATGDGVTDDTAILQELIDANDYVYIPSGEYLIHSTIRVGEGKRVIGDGCGATVLKLASSFNLLGYAWRGTAGASTIHSTISPMLAIEGNDVLVEGIGTHDGNTFTEQYGKTRAGILVVNSSNVSVRNCGATDINTIDPEDGTPENGECAGFGLYVLGSSNIIVDGGRYYNCGYECIGVETSHAVFIENADIDTGWRCACQVHRDAYDVHFDNNKIVQDLGSDTYTSGAIILDGRSTDGLWDIFIRGNWIYARTPDWDVTDGGIKCVMANEYNVIITGNTIDVSHYAISDQNYEQTYLNNPRNWIISNNIIKSLYKGICHERISNIIITGNLIDCPNEAVRVKTGCVVDNNIFLDNSTVTYIN